MVFFRFVGQKISNHVSPKAGGISIVHHDPQYGSHWIENSSLLSQELLEIQILSLILETWCTPADG